MGKLWSHAQIPTCGSDQVLKMSCPQYSTLKHNHIIETVLMSVFIENTLESKLGCILLGWEFIPSSSSLPRFLASLSSYTEYLPWIPTYQGFIITLVYQDITDSPITYSTFDLNLCLCVLSVKKRVMTISTSPCVHCVIKCVTTGNWAQCAHWPEQHIYLTMESRSCLLFSCLCGVTLIFFYLISKNCCACSGF